MLSRLWRVYVARLNLQEAARAPSVGDPAGKLDAPVDDYQPPWSSNLLDVGKIWRIRKRERGQGAFSPLDRICTLYCFLPGWLLVEEH